MDVRRHVWTGVIRPGDFVSGGLVAVIIMYIDLPPSELRV